MISAPGKDSPVNPLKLGRLSFVRQIYRRLLEYGRTYAAFDRTLTFRRVKTLAVRSDRIVDPMSGYGTLMMYCAELGIRSVNVELNPPSHYWQVLMNPANFEVMDRYVSSLRAEQSLPRPPVRASISEDWYSDESRELAIEMYFRVRRIAEGLGVKGKDATKIALAVYLPFVARFSTFVQGNIVIEAKKGGICILQDWESDFRAYLDFLRRRLAADVARARCLEHENILADCRTLGFGRERFDAFITSPSYPNYKDYRRVFAPENAFLDILERVEPDYVRPVGTLIGSIEVKNRKNEDQSNLLGTIANDFLNQLLMSKGGKKALSDIRSYYYRYFLNFFMDLQQAYSNLSTWLSKDARGYIIVVNNSSRGRPVPLAEFTIESFERLGFRTSIDEVREVSHVGGLNPRLKGRSARHSEYVIFVDRNA